MIDINSTKYSLNLLNEIPGLKKKSNTNGGEYSGACPWCHGTDRFSVQPFHPGGARWFCRGCGDGKWHDALDFVCRRDGVTLHEAAKRLAIPGQIKLIADVKSQPVQPYQAPEGVWQNAANKVIQKCQENLFQPIGKKALDYVYSRGLTDKTIQKYQLGYSPGIRQEGYFVPFGVTIPCIARNHTWYIKIRSLPGVDQSRYLNMAGSKPNALFGGDDLMLQPFSMIVEGEINCMTLHQEVGDMIAVASPGSAANKLDPLTWGRFFLNQRFIMALFDDDAAGRKGIQNMHELLGDRLKVVKLPGKQDANEFYLAGGDLVKWFIDAFKSIDPLDDSSLVEYIQKIGRK